MKRTGKVQDMKDFNDIESPRRQRLLEKMDQIAKNHGGRLLGIWRENDQTMGRFECIEGHRWTACVHNIHAGHWCGICRNRLFTKERCQKEVAKKNGNCLRIWRERDETWGEFVCDKRHPPWIAPVRKVIGGRWCGLCALDRQRIGIIKCRQHARHRGGRCLSMTYINATMRLHWQCAKGHEWRVKWSHVRQGYWCPVCALEKKMNKKRKKGK